MPGHGVMKASKAQPVAQSLTMLVVTSHVFDIDLSIAFIDIVDMIRK